ncbi:glycosyltransferase family 2 protein [Ferruginibacter lapsinanis]|uniref:glycosyltransferase family 2 protein n=1 Tax=Ferruginibacter lapsinanis TaxID=563172 RepID=UPI001E2FC850|nr:glycosyltransferase family 2 protein [Ferruginibacter lapsinanis]UEG50570.1 glycosyltransferase family 2 protein [Ferruginibacter lapsinanis]
MVDIIIVNWNSGDYIKDCITSVFIPENESILGKVIIVDNNSADESLQLVLQRPQIEIIKNAENVGFAKACNQGFLAGNAEYVLFLNPDTQLQRNTLSDCLAYMEGHKETDIVGCQLLDDDGKISPSCARFPTPKTFFYDALGLSKIAPRLFTPAILMTDWDHKESRFVDQLTGAFMFMRRKVFERLGYFDERFFVYYEELDFSLRLHKMGGRSFFNAAIKAHHTGGGTTNKVKAYRLFLTLRSRLLYAKKNFSVSGCAFVSFTTFIIEPFSRLLFLIGSARFKEIKDLAKAYILLIKSRRIFSK